MWRGSIGPVRWLPAAVAALLVVCLLEPFAARGIASGDETVTNPSATTESSVEATQEPTPLVTEPPVDTPSAPVDTPVPSPTEPPSDAVVEPSTPIMDAPVIETPTESTVVTSPPTTSAATPMARPASEASSRTAAALTHQLAIVEKGYKVGSTVVVNGSGWGPGTSIRVSFRTTTMTTVRVDSRGTFAASFRVPAVVGGRHQVAAQISWLRVRTYIVVVLSVKLVPTTVVAQGRLAVSVEGFGANEALTFNVLDRIVIGRGRADATGRFSGTFTLPSSIKPGRYTFRAKGGTGTVVRATLVVTVAAPLSAGSNTISAAAADGTAIRSAAVGWGRAPILAAVPARYPAATSARATASSGSLAKRTLAPTTDMSASSAATASGQAPSRTTGRPSRIAIATSDSVPAPPPMATIADPLAATIALRACPMPVQTAWSTNRFADRAS
jgi:hypothetical protein